MTDPRHFDRASQLEGNLRNAEAALRRAVTQVQTIRAMNRITRAGHALRTHQMQGEG